MSCFLPFLGILGLQATETYYVSPSGDDTNSGTDLASPFETIQRAADLAVAGDIIEIRAGTYRETVNVPQSGTSGNPIIFRSYNGEEVILSGGDLVTGWTNTGNDIWTTQVNWNANNDREANTLFVNGALSYEARQGAENDLLDADDWGQMPNGSLSTGSAIFEPNDLSGFGDDYWNGAKILYQVVDWGFQVRTIADYRSSDGRITFDSAVGGNVSQKQTNIYYIYDTLNALDQPGEWFKEDGGDTLYYKAASGQNPNSLSIEFKRRAHAFDVSDRDHIHIENMIFRGASIRTSADTDANVYRGNVLFAYDKDSYGRFFINGDNNVFRDNEVYQTWISAVTVNGESNSLINNYFHDIGHNPITRALGMSGESHFVSRNTFRKISRSVLDGYPSRSEISYNLFEDAGRLSYDSGIFDSDGSNGNNSYTIFHHNLFRNTNSRGITKTYYGRNNNAVFHHNIIYDWVGSSTQDIFAAFGIDFRQVYHNTIITDRELDGRDPDNGSIDPGAVVQTRYNNNLQMSLEGMEALGVDLRGNHDYTSADFEDFAARDLRLKAGSAAIDAGIVLPRINDGFNGSAPDAGAIEFGDDMWAVGHDFNNPPNPVFSWEALPGTNLYSNSQFNGGISDWTINSGSPFAQDFNSWNLKGEGNSLTGFFRTKSVEFQPGTSISQVFTGLKPNTTYTLGAAARVIEEVTTGGSFDASSGSVSTDTYRGVFFASQISGSDWVRYDNIDFGDSGQFDLMEILYCRATPTGPIAGAAIEIRIDSPNGQLLGTFPLLKDDPAQSWFRSRESLSPIAGVHDLYISVTGSNAANVAVGPIRILKDQLPESDKLTVSTQSGSASATRQVGWTDWQLGYETFQFQTGPTETSATITLQNNGRIDLYLDRLYLVEGVVRAGTNLAYLVGIASQSSTAAGSDPLNALDEDNATLAETTDSSNSWWQVRFANEFSIGEIEIFNRDDSRADELGNFTVTVFAEENNGSLTSLWSKAYFATGNVPQGGSFKISSGQLADDGVTRLASAHGRIIRIQLNGQNNAGNGHLTLADVKVQSSNVVKPPSNIALFSEASQSTNNYFLRDFADEANNGKIDPVAAFTTTDDVGTPWWQVALPQETPIDQIVIYNRRGDENIASRIGTFRVSLWNDDPDSGGSELWGRNYSYNSSAGRVSTNSIGNGYALRIDGSVTSGGTALRNVTGARYVRIRKTSTNFLSLAEVQVWQVSTLVDLDQVAYNYDPGTSASIFPGATLLSPSVSGDIFFSGGPVTATDRNTPGQNEYNRDFISGSSPATLNHRIANGRYGITLNMSDPEADLDNMYVRAESQDLATDIDRLIGENLTFEVPIDVSDGELNLEFGDADLISPRWAVNRIVLNRIPSGPPILTPGGTLVAANTDVTFSSSDSDGVGLIYYTIDGSDPRTAGNAVSPTAILASGGSVTQDNVLADFENVSTPNLPSGWSETTTNASSTWATVSANGGTAVQVPNDNSTADARLTSAPFNVTTSSRIVRFQNSYNTENNWDGGILEISINGQSFQELTSAGGTFVEGGYNNTLRNSNQPGANPLNGQSAWSGNSNGFINTGIELPQSAVGQSVELRWRFGSDFTEGGNAWTIDNVRQEIQIPVSGNYTLTQDTRILARTLIGSRWSSLRDITYMIDSDSDGLPDSTEQTLYGHPTANTDGTDDYDADGQDDRSEWIAGTDIEDPSSSFRVTQLMSQPSGDPADTILTIEWSTVPGKRYTIWQSTSLANDSWTVMEDNIQPTGNTDSRTITVNGATEWFFRISVE